MELYPEFDCTTCDMAKKLQRGCDNDAPFAYWTDLTGAERSRCPRLPIFKDPDWWFGIVSAYNTYNAGFLPHAGGMNNQAATFPFIMHCFSSVYEQVQSYKRDKDIGIKGEKPRPSSL